MSSPVIPVQGSPERAVSLRSAPSDVLTAAAAESSAPMKVLPVADVSLPELAAAMPMLRALLAAVGREQQLLDFAAAYRARRGRVPLYLAGVMLAGALLWIPGVALIFVYREVAVVVLALAALALGGGGAALARLGWRAARGTGGGRRRRARTTRTSATARR